MSAAPKVTTTLVCCGAVHVETRAVCADLWPGAVLRPQGSLLHMEPARLAARLEAVVDRELGRGRRVLLVYGDCCERLAALESRPGVARTRCRNCCELLLGAADYRGLSHEGAFFLLPEWTRRWREIFVSKLGLSRSNATDLMQDLHRTLVYLDTGLAPVPDDDLRECSDYCGLPVEVRRVSLARLRGAVAETLDRLAPRGILT